MSGGFINKDNFTVTRVDPIRWKTQTPLAWEGHQDDRVLVEAGFATDFATSPWFTQWLVPRTGTWTLAAVAHDKLCELLNERYRQVLEIRDRTGLPMAACQRLVEPCLYGPVDTDGAFRAMMEDECVDPIRRWLMWVGVRWGALRNPARRVGWWRTAHLVLPASALVLYLAWLALLGVAWAVTRVKGWA